MEFNRHIENKPPEMQIVENCIISKSYYTRLKDLIDVTAFDEYKCRLLIDLIKNYYDEFEDVPGSGIKQLYASRKPYLTNPEQVDQLDVWLSVIEYDEPIHNVEYHIKQGLEYLRLKSIDTLCKDLKKSVDLKDPDIGENAVTNFRKIQENSMDGFFLYDHKAYEGIEDQSQEVVLELPGAMGAVAGKWKRGDINAVMARTGLGKSTFLQYCGIHAAHTGYNTLYINLEITKPQTLHRYLSMASGRPAFSNGNDKYYLPYFDYDAVTLNEDVLATKFPLKFRCERRRPLSPKDREEFMKTRKISAGLGSMYTLNLPSGRTTIEDVFTKIDLLKEHYGFETDILIIDYIDKLKKFGLYGSPKYAIEDLWIYFKGGCLERNILGITASQTNRDGFSKDAGLDSQANAIGKANEVSSFIVLNQSEIEEKLGVIRMECKKQRTEKRNVQQALILQNLEIGQYHLDSLYVDNVDYSNSLNFLENLKNKA